MANYFDVSRAWRIFGIKRVIAGVGILVALVLLALTVNQSRIAISGSTLTSLGGGESAIARGETSALETRVAEADRTVAAQLKETRSLRELVDKYEAELNQLRPQLAELRQQVAGLQQAVQRSIRVAPQPPDMAVTVASTVLPAPPAHVRSAATDAAASTAVVVGTPVSCAGALSKPDQLMVLQFDRGEGTLRLEHHKTLDVLVATLKACPTLALEIKGYSDNRGSSKLNETLSLRRAELTAKYFEAHGIDPELMTVEGMASASPLASNTSEDGRARNRRVEIAVVKQP